MLQTVHFPPELSSPCLYTARTQKAEDIGFACSSLGLFQCSFFFFLLIVSTENIFFVRKCHDISKFLVLDDI